MSRQDCLAGTSPCALVVGVYPVRDPVSGWGRNTQVALIRAITFAASDPGGGAPSVASWVASHPVGWLEGGGWSGVPGILPRVPTTPRRTTARRAVIAPRSMGHFLLFW